MAFDSAVDQIPLDDGLRTRPVLCAVTQMFVFPMRDIPGLAHSADDYRDRAAWGQEEYEKQVRRVEQHLAEGGQTG